ncbi:hypothetical protein [Streptomyces sp. HUAS ZL42]|uniref:hypothetical protein n=1 Tax=Streptomyces sp. HUAS ZL42 TaxID=3231715 RepID=UPI00345E8751
MRGCTSVEFRDEAPEQGAEGLVVLVRPPAEPFPQFDQQYVRRLDVDSSQFCDAVTPPGPTPTTAVPSPEENNRVTMLAEKADGVIGVDTHRDTLAAAAVSLIGTTLTTTSPAIGAGR